VAGTQIVHSFMQGCSSTPLADTFLRCFKKDTQTYTDMYNF